MGSSGIGLAAAHFLPQPTVSFGDFPHFTIVKIAIETEAIALNTSLVICDTVWRPRAEWSSAQWAS
jgi:hypothetical protein